ncbi:MAG: NAD(P)H-binding protein [Pseudomonadota bacterium]
MTIDPAKHTSPPGKPAQRIFLLGATGSIGRAVYKALKARGHSVVCFVRPQSERPSIILEADMCAGDVGRPESVLEDGLQNEAFDAVVSCMGSRTGEPSDAWAVDHDAHLSVLTAAKSVGVKHFVLLSAICVQKPELAFQKAKLAFEETLIASGMTYSIVRPTAFFKSLSGQVERVMAGKPYMLFGDGKATACKPISDRDLAAYMADCLTDPELQNRILPIGGPGPAVTPREQGEALFEILDREPRFSEAPLWLMDLVAGILTAVSWVLPPLRSKAALARIGKYYATESMLVWDPVTGAYDADATPSTGTDTLFEHYAQLIDEGGSVERGPHKVF